MIHLVLFLSEAELFQPLLLRHGVVDEGAGLLLRLAPSAADHAINSTVQDVEALLGKQRSSDHGPRRCDQRDDGASLKRCEATYVRGDAAPAAAGCRIRRLQFTDDLLQLSSRELRVWAGAELRPEVFQALDGNVLPGLNQRGTKENSMNCCFSSGVDPAGASPCWR